MLVLSRKVNETIVIDGNIRVTVVGARGSQIRLGIEAPDKVGIYREELCAPARAAEAREERRPRASASRRAPNGNH